MRATTHNGRTGRGGACYSVKHNDRAFDVSRADNIDVSRSDKNVYVTWNGAETFEQAEKDFYEQYLSEALNKQNERYVKQRHAERCKTLDEFRLSRQHCAEERILQCGDIEEHADADTFNECVREYVAEFEHAMQGHARVLDYAIHHDEAVPHAHIRAVYLTTTADGTLTTGQEKALAAASFERPNPSAAAGQRNNRKMTFDAHMRAAWLDILEAHGFKIEREPLANAAHNRSKQSLLRDIARAERELDEYDEYIADSASELSTWTRAVDEKKQTLDELTAEVDKLQDVSISLDEKIADKRIELDGLDTEIARRRSELAEAHRTLSETFYELEDVKTRLERSRTSERAVTAELNMLKSRANVLRNKQKHALELIERDKTRSVSLFDEFKQSLEDLLQRLREWIDRAQAAYYELDELQREEVNDMSDLLESLAESMNDETRRARQIYDEYVSDYDELEHNVNTAYDEEDFEL